MNRGNRLEPVRKAVDDTERRRAEKLAASEQRLGECERKLHELEEYQSDYRQTFNSRASGGIGSAGLRDYQLFLARLAEAIRQQTQLVTAMRSERDLEQKRWQEAARRCKAIDHVVDHWHAEERRAGERREQRDSDERAQRAAHVKDER
jgi:flagellar FliJ protein